MTRPAYVVHWYVSTYCQHEEHMMCKADAGFDTNGQIFTRIPAQCKLCAAPCRCPCHDDLNPQRKTHA